MRRPLTPSAATGAVIAELRTRVEGPGPNRYLAPDIATTVTMARSGDFIGAAEDAIGPLD